MKEFSVLMSLFDYIPVFLFTAAVVILIRALYNKMSKGAFALFAAGTVDVIAAGFLKATYKLLYSLGISDFTSLSAVFFPMQSLGFMLSGLGMAALICHRQTERNGGEKKDGRKAVIATASAFIVFVVALLIIGSGKDKTTAPPYFSGTFVFVTLMILGLALTDVSLSVLSVKLRKKSLITLFVLSFVFSLMMGYLSSRDFDKASMNWIAEGVNTLGQLTLLIGAKALNKNGLEKLRLHGEEKV